MKYNHNFKYRRLVKYLGLVIVILGILEFLIVSSLAFFGFYLPKMTEILGLGILLIGAGSTFFTLSKYLGWHDSPILNFLLNQFSLIIIAISFIGIGLSLKTKSLDVTSLMFILLALLGVSLVIIGAKNNSIH